MNEAIPVVNEAIPVVNEASRREFLRAAAASLAAVGAGSNVLAEQEDSPQGIP
ncbi:hypothetical protein LCGC14_3107900, partial [marine sediment metagenome]